MSESGTLRKDDGPPLQILLEVSPGVHCTLCPWGSIQRFENEFIEGRVFFAHQPPPGSDIPFSYLHVLEARGAPVPLWELQVQARLKVKPRGTLFVGGELRDKPLELGLVARSVITVILKFLGSLAKQRGHELQHSFGNRSGEQAMVGFPLTGADRIYCSDTAVPLPILGCSEKGAWKQKDGEWISVDRHSVKLDIKGYTTFLFATSRFDLATWTATGIPGIGTFQLKRFCGYDPWDVVCYDENEATKEKRYWFHMRVVRSENDEEVAQLGNYQQVAQAPEASATDLKLSAVKSQSKEVPLECQYADKDEMEEWQENETEDHQKDIQAAKHGESEQEGISESQVVVNFPVGERLDEVEHRLNKNSESQTKGEQGEGGENKQESIWESQALNFTVEECLSDATGNDSPKSDVTLPPCVAKDTQQPDVRQDSTLERPTVGERVRVLKTGRCGELTTDDGSEMPYKVFFQDGLFPATDWFRGSALIPEGDNTSGLVQYESASPTSLPAPAVKDGLQALTFKLDTGADEKTLAERHASPVTSLLPPSVPWYFRSVAGAMWWGIAIAGQLRWRPHAHIQALCETLMPAALFHLKDAALGVSADDLEYARRLVEEVIIKGQKVPGMLEEFLNDEMDLNTLLNSSSAPSPWESVAVVEAEGCLFELPMVLMSEQLMCYHPGLSKVLSFNLDGASVEISTLAGAPALLLTTVARQYMLVLRNDLIAKDWATRLDTITTLKFKPSDDTFESVLTRWEKHRCVLNNRCLCLTPPEDALALSASLLQLALKAQDTQDVADLRKLKQTSCALKCTDLSYLPPQGIWGFWVNVFHCLLLHARMVGGLPNGLSQTIDFYNRHCYVVAGHIFSLVEVEHSILRCRMSRPHLRLQRFVLKVWQRSEEDLEQRPCIGAPWCPAEAFRCRPDWRLNLVLSAGNCSSSDALPVFQACNQKKFDALIAASVDHALGFGGQVCESRIELPYNLYRYRDDAPPGGARESTEMRWAHALFPGKQLNGTKVFYSRRYDWTMRPKLRAL